MRAIVRRLHYGFVLLVVLAFSATARAEETSDSAKEARRLFEKAELSFNVGKFAEALTDYQAAYEAKPLNGFLFNIAQCYRNLGDYERARFFFRRYLTLEPRTPNRRRVESLIDEMTKKLEEKAAAAPATPSSPTAPVTTPPPAPSSPPETTPVEPASPTPASPAPANPTLPAAPAPNAGEAVPSVVAVAAEPEAPPASPVYTRWWFWTGVGVVVLGGAAAAFFLTRPETRAPGTLDPIDGRP